MKRNKFEKKWTRWVNAKHILAIAVLMAGATCFADEFGAITSGNWNNPLTWTPTGTPGAGDEVFIGSTDPDGAASIATVTLIQNEYANDVFLGFGSSDTAGTLDLGNYKLSIGGGLFIGYNSGGTGTVKPGSGSFSASYLWLDNGNTFTFRTLDTVSSLYVWNSATATTKAAGNVTGNVYIYNGSKLTLGADMKLGGTLDLSDTDSTLDMAEHSLKANEIDFGWNNSGELTTLSNRGRLTATYLKVANQPFDLYDTDSITNFYLSNGTSKINTPLLDLYLYNGSTATTCATGIITRNVGISSGSTLTLGTDMTLSGTLDLRDTNSTLDMAKHSLSAAQISFGWDNDQLTTLSNRGQLTATDLYVANQPFDLKATDSITNSFYLRNGTSTINTPLVSLYLSTKSTAATTAAGNVTGNVQIYSGSTLTLGADMTLIGGVLDLSDTDSTLDMAGHALSAAQISFGWDNDQLTTLSNRGRLTATDLYVANQPFDLYDTDSITNSFSLRNGTSTINTPLVSLYLSTNSTAATTAAGNVTGNVQIYSGSTLTLGADMTLSGTLDLQDTDSTLDMAGHDISADQIFFGWNSEGLPTLLHSGHLTANYLYVANQTFNLNATDSISNFYLTNGTSTINTTILYLDLNNSTAATAAAGNVTGSVNIYNSKLTLGADMKLSGYLSLWGDTGSTLDMAGHSLNADQLYFGWGGTNMLLNSGRISANSLYVANTNALTLHPGDLIENYLTLSNASTLTVLQANGQLTGLTFNGPWQGSLNIDDTSMLNLNFGQSSSSHWIFRWRDPIYYYYAGNWGDVLTSLISAGQISINPSNGYYLADQGGYTYIYAVAQPANFDWKGGDGAGPTDWSLAANWNPNTGVPDGKGVVISFGAQSAANNIVDLGSDGKTVGGLIFVIATSTTIQSSGGHDLTLDNDGEISTIYVSGNHYITTPVILNNDAQIIGLGTLTLSGGISGPYNLDVQGNLIASSIEVDTLTIGSDTSLTIPAIADGPSGDTITSVPEPSTLVLMGIASIGLLAYVWRRKKRAA